MGGDLTTTLTRLDRVWVALPYALLVVCAGLAAFSGDIPAGDIPLTTMAAVGLVVWHGWWILAHPQWPEARLMPMAVYFAGLLLLTDYLTSLSMAFFPLYLVCYPMAFVALPGLWAYAGVVVTAVVALLGPPLQDWTIEDVMIGLGAAVLVSVSGGAIRALEAETIRRRSAMAALQHAHADLERALEVNLALQDRLLREARESGISAERTRLAGEIHDTLAAGLAGIVSQLEALGANLRSDDPLHSRVTASAELARESLQEARRSVRALRPAVVTGATLPAALGAAVTRCTRLHQLPVHFHVTGESVLLPAEVEDVLIRAVEEGLVNIIRHAAAHTAHVTLSYLGDRVAVDVSDDGAGMHPTPSDDGQGLAIMRERVVALGGDVEVRSHSGAGTTLTVTVPLSDTRGG